MQGHLIYTPIKSVFLQFLWSTDPSLISFSSWPLSLPKVFDPEKESLGRDAQSCEILCERVQILFLWSCSARAAWCAQVFVEKAETLK